MTYEELLLATCQLSLKLDHTAVKLLWHLIGTAINEGHNEIHTTTRELSKKLKCWRGNITQAAEELKPYIRVSTSQRHGYTFQLPAEWFSESQGIFTDFWAVEKPSERSEDRSNDGPEDDPSGPKKPIHSRRTEGENRSTDGPQTDPPTAKEWRNRSKYGSETGQLPQQNQQLTGGEIRGSKDPDPLIQLQDYGSIQHIACSKVLLPEQRADGMELLSAICTYHRQHAPANRETGSVPEVIIARCLAVAPLGELLSELKQMRIRDVRAGRSYGWYPAVFCQRLKGIHPKIWAAALQHFAKLARQQSQASLDFSTQLTAEIRQQMRRIS
jgi:hypothetical protein